MSFKCRNHKKNIDQNYFPRWIQHRASCCSARRRVWPSRIPHPLYHSLPSPLIPSNPSKPIPSFREIRLRTLCNLQNGDMYIYIYIWGSLANSPRASPTGTQHTVLGLSIGMGERPPTIKRPFASIRRYKPTAAEAAQRTQGVGRLNALLREKERAYCRQSSPPPRGYLNRTLP